MKLNPKMNIGEFDLIEIGDNCAVDATTIRPWQFDQGNMMLKPIRLQNDVTVCIKSIVVPGADVPAFASIAPCSSSFETSMSMRSSSNCSI